MSSNLNYKSISIEKKIYRLCLYNASWICRRDSILTGPLATCWRNVDAFSSACLLFLLHPACNFGTDLFFGDAMSTRLLL